ncbi:MAG: DUF342 domain-containing protein [bacterium]|nr:DUF342 domain-containing protein [bacterium]
MSGNTDMRTVAIHISADHLTADLEIGEHRGGTELTLEALRAQVVRDGIAIDADVEQRLAHTATRALSEAEPFRAVIADVRARDSGINWDEGCDPTAMTVATLPGEGVDHYNRVVYVKVKTGDRVATIQPPLERFDVTGTPLNEEATEGGLIVDEGTLSIAPDGTVTAQLHGVLTIEGETVFVSRRLLVPGDVDFSTGNVDFDGSVHVRAGVKDRFVVSATEDVLVDGLIEAATIVTGGALQCRQGMAAKDRGVITVGTNAELGFLNNVQGKVCGDLIVLREILNCDVSVGGTLVCPRGALIGGRVEVGKSVSVGTLGSPAGVPTTLVVGIGESRDISSVDDLLATLAEGIAAIKREYDARKRSARSHEEREQLMELGFEIHERDERLEELQAKRDDAARLIKDNTTVDVTIARRVCLGVSLLAGDTTVTFDRDLEGPVVLSWDEDRRLVFRQAGSASRPLSDVARVIRQAA